MPNFKIENTLQKQVFLNKPVIELLEKYKRVWALGHASAVMGWDFETFMPLQGSKARGIANAELSLIRQKYFLDLKEPLERAANQKDLTDEEKGIVRVMRRQLDYYEKVPPELLGKLAKKRSESMIVWRVARKNSDYNSFKPHLKELAELRREEAERLGYEKHPYNALLDRNEEGLTIEDLDKIFSKLIPSLKRIISTVTREKRFPRRHELESVAYEIPAIEKVNDLLLDLLEMPVGQRFRMDLSTHPFTTGFALDDVRMTTRYEGTDFRSSMYSTMHEAGHAIYNLQINHGFEFTPIASGASGGVHESQSRFIENVVGRSIEFAKVVTPILKSNLKFLKKYDEEDLYLYFNLVRPSLIRVDADELTYNLHIAVRYEIEKKVIIGDASVSDLPSLWNDLFENYLGTKPRKDSDGVLQDIHWGAGGFGGFPSYTLGNIIDGIIWHEISSDFDLKATIRAKNIPKIRKWLEKRIHRYGATYAPKVLLKQEFGEGYNPEWLIKYLESKYLDQK
jgi:carboxypeptidase Taq